MGTDDVLVALWVDALQAAFRLAKADRARQLRGDYTVRAFDSRGLHPYSVEWGRVMAIEGLMPDLTALRLPGDGGPDCDWMTLRRFAAIDAELEFADAVRAGEGDLWFRR